jgi:hypothetical protein
MLELGNQHFKGSLKAEMRAKFKTKAAKPYFESLGIEHVSFDLNGQDGAIPIDLSIPLKESQYYNYFDIVTDAGTSEHVDPLSGQYECFRNIHLCTKPGGIMVQINPEYKTHPKHSNNYYSMDFWETVASLNRYKIIYLEVLMKDTQSSLLACCLEKVDNSPFTDQRKVLLKKIFRKEKNRISHYVRVKKKA